MRFKFLHGLLLFTISLTSFSQDNSLEIITNSTCFIDQTRHRSVPVLIYSTKQKVISKPLVIINHGYTLKNSEYSFIANSLAKRGYLVISIQQNLKTDKELSKNGSLFQRRMPMWERGVENIQFVLKEFNRIKPGINKYKIILIGHSNGGDISMLFAKKYPQQVFKIISLDSLRMPFPKNKNFDILTLRAKDTKADAGVLPNKENQQLRIILLKDAKHIDLCDRGSAAIQKEIEAEIVDFLNER